MGNGGLVGLSLTTLQSCRFVGGPQNPSSVLTGMTALFGASHAWFAGEYSRVPRTKKEKATRCLLVHVANGEIWVHAWP